MPFIQALGNDFFNPSEVIHEFTADVGIKKGEKADYAINIDGKLSILIECKPSSIDLDLKHASQLFRYFSTTDARISILTNGVSYQFYSDIEQPNKMGNKPFYIFSMDGIKRTDPPILDGFTKNSFNIDAISAEAGKLKLQSQMRIELEKEFANPSEEFVRLMLSRLYNGRATSAMKEHYHAVLTASISAIVRDRVNERLTSALNVANPTAIDIEEGGSDDMSEGSGIITTDDEIGGFRIVQAIAARHVNPERVVIRDSKSYCAILLDDNNRKTIARLHFNSPTTRHVGTFAGKVETRSLIANLTDIYKLENEIVVRLNELEKKGDTST